MIEKLYYTLEKLKNTTSRTEKENILRENQDDNTFKEVIKFLFDDLITTGLSAKKISKPINPVNIKEPELVKLLTYLQQNNSGRDKDIAIAKGYINAYKKKYDSNIAEMIKSIIIKDYPVGVSKITLNKIYGKDFIFKFDVRKGSKFDGKLRANTTYDVSIKLDGVRCVALVNDKGTKLYGRSGKEIKGLSLIEKSLNAFYEVTQKPMMFDGELLAHNEDSLTSDELFKLTSGILRRDGNKENITYILFDCMPMEEFIEGKSKLPFIERREQFQYCSKELQKIASNITKDKKQYFSYVETLYQGSNSDEIQRVHKEVEDRGFEGTMLNDVNAFYESKRTKSLLKFKTFYTMDLLVTDIVEHVRGGKLGSIIVDYKGYKLQVGSGFSEEQRVTFWKHKEQIMNKLVEVGYFEESKDKNGNLSLRFPTFKRVRDDKNITDVSYN